MLFSLPIINTYTNLSFGQQSVFKDFLRGGFQYNFVGNNLNFKNTLGSVDLKMDFIKPSNTLLSFGRNLGIPQNFVVPFADEADKSTDKPNFLKRAIIWLGKNWEAILAGVLTVAQAIKISKGGEGSEYQNQTDLGNYTGTTNTNIPTPTNGGFGGGNVGGTGNGIVDIIQNNLLPIGIGLGLYLYFRK